MIDTTSGDRLVVSDAGDAEPYIIVPVTQLDDVSRLLDANKIVHTVDEAAVSLNDSPFYSVINLTRGANIESIQRILDGRQ